MKTYITPEACGISSAKIERFVRILNDNGYAMHSIMMSRGDSIFAEGYWAPFNSETMYRMNSITKSFVGVAVGLLIEEGKLCEDDRIIKYFPDYSEDDIPEFVRELTVHDLLTMRTTSLTAGHWVRDKVMDRVPLYFNIKPSRPNETMFRYDSTGSFILGVIVEKLTGKPFIEYMKDRLLNKLDFAEETCCIKGPDGYSWGDSGLLIKMHDLHTFAKFVMDGGVYKGERLMNGEFLRRATLKISDTTLNGYKSHNTFGYGMQIWKTYDDGFAFFGMGDQLVICVPKKQFIFICTADNQDNPGSRPVILDRLHHDIIDELSDTPLPENKAAYDSLTAYLAGMKLVSLEGGRSSDAAKKLDFVLGDNLITEFPEEGYPDMQMNVPCPGNKYPCAVSAAWLEERKLGIRVQMVYKHLGGLMISIGFTPDLDRCEIYMVKNTNCFLNEYNGWAAGVRSEKSE